MRRYHNAALNSSTGQPVASPTITVYHAGTTTTATIYSDEGVTTKANPFTGDALGRFDFYAADGDYDIKVEGSGITAYTIADVTLGDVKRAQGVSESETVLLANAWYRRSGTPGYDRRNTSLAAWAVELDADAAQDYMRVLRAAAGANPITWTELLRIVAGGQLAPGLGAVGAPSYAFLGDLDTGIWSPGANLLGFSTAGLERLRINASYSVLLRQTTADYTVQWNNPAAARTLTLIDPGGNDDFVFAAASQVLSNKAGVPFVMGGSSGAGTLATTGVEYLAVEGLAVPAAAEADRQWIAHGAMSAIGLRIRLGTAPGTGATRRFTLRVNEVDTALVVTIADTATSGAATGAVAIAAGDRLSLKSDITAGTPAASVVQAALRVRETAV